MTVDRSFGEKAEKFVLCFAAEGIASRLRGDDNLYQSEHVDNMHDFLVSACRGLEVICRAPYTGRNLAKDLDNIKMLCDACPEYQELDPSKLLYKIDAFLNNLKSLKEDGKVKEYIKEDLASLCDSLENYTFSKVKSGPAT